MTTFDLPDPEVCHDCGSHVCLGECKEINVSPPQLTASCLDCGTRTALKDFGLLGHSAPDGRACSSRRHRPGSIRVVAP